MPKNRIPQQCRCGHRWSEYILTSCPQCGAPSNTYPEKLRKEDALLKAAPALFAALLELVDVAPSRLACDRERFAAAMERAEAALALALAQPAE